MIQTWIGDVTPLLDEGIYQGYYDRLPQWRKEKADKLKNLKRAQSAGAWILYQKMQERYGFSDSAVYNLSHSGRYAMCTADVRGDNDGRKIGDFAKSDGICACEKEMVVKLGCDVEMIKSVRPGVAKRFFCPAEEAYIMGQETEECRAEAFYRYWVLKESFVKAVREGLRLELQSFEIRIEKEGPVLIRQPEAYPETYYYHEYELEAGDAKCAVCSTSPEFSELRIIEL